MEHLDRVQGKKTMWLPEPVYKALPTAYAVIGVAFILGVLYVGPNAPMGNVYLGLGMLSILAAVTVSIWRGRHKQDRAQVDTDDPQTD